ncbi:MAG: protein kinase [Polyangiaceae bacterium]
MESRPDLPAGIPQIGEVFAEKYRIESVLGLGGMGIVLLAIHIHLEERVAIKLLLPAIATNPEYVSRFLREGRAAIKIRSEHVGRVIDVGKPADGAPYLVMEYLQGTDLSRVIEDRGRMPIMVAVDYLLQAGEALAEAHAMGTIHRDLKPGNLFLTTRADGSACVKVLDFGISKVADGITPSADYSMTKSTTLMGSPLYMSPEQLRSLRSVDCRTDIWALGIILFEMLVGTPPFEGETLPDLSVQIITTTPPLLRSKRPDAPQGLEAIISRCLEKDVSKRIAHMGELARLLAPFGSPAAAISLERINRTLGPVPISADSSGKISIRDPSAQSGSNPMMIAAEGVARTEVAWDTQSTPGMKKKQPPFVLAAILCAGALGFVVVFALASHFKKPPEPIPTVGMEAPKPLPVTPPSATAVTTVVPDAGAVLAVAHPPEHVVDHHPSARPHPPVFTPKLPPSAAPSQSVPPKSSAPTGVTLDRHG